MPQLIDLNDVSPSAPANALNVKWQKGAQTGTDAATGLPIFPASANVPILVGDSGAGGSLGLVPAPAAGDAALGKVLVADGAFHTPQLIIGFGILDGSVGTEVTLPQTAPRAGQITACAVRVKASDGSTALTFAIRKNGVDVFVTDPTVAAAVGGDSLFTFTNLTASPLLVAKHDKFTIDISSGSAAWQFTAQLE